MVESTLRNIDDGVWTLGNRVRMLGLNFDGHMTVLRGRGGALLLYSPVPIDDAVAAQIDALGKVSAIVAPNAFHHLFAERALDRYPKASLYMSAALRDKCSDLATRATVLASGEALELHDGEFRTLAIAGMPRLEEIVVFHAASGTLVIADLLMNIHSADGLLTQWTLKLEGVWGKMAMPRLFRLLVKERKALRESLSTVLSWPVRKIVPTHGEIVADDGADVLRACFAWV